MHPEEHAPDRHGHGRLPAGIALASAAFREDDPDETRQRDDAAPRPRRGPPSRSWHGPVGSGRAKTRRPDRSPRVTPWPFVGAGPAARLTAHQRDGAQRARRVGTGSAPVTRRARRRDEPAECHRPRRRPVVAVPVAPAAAVVVVVVEPSAAWWSWSTALRGGDRLGVELLRHRELRRHHGRRGRRRTERLEMSAWPVEPSTNRMNWASASSLSAGQAARGDDEIALHHQVVVVGGGVGRAGVEGDQVVGVLATRSRRKVASVSAAWAAAADGATKAPWSFWMAAVGRSQATPSGSPVHTGDHGHDGAEVRARRHGAGGARPRGRRRRSCRSWPGRPRRHRCRRRASARSAASSSTSGRKAGSDRCERGLGRRCAVEQGHEGQILHRRVQVGPHDGERRTGSAGVVRWRRSTADTVHRPSGWLEFSAEDAIQLDEAEGDVRAELGRLNRVGPAYGWRRGPGSSSATRTGGEGHVGERAAVRPVPHSASPDRQRPLRHGVIGGELYLARSRRSRRWPCPCRRWCRTPKSGASPAPSSWRSLPMTGSSASPPSPTRVPAVVVAPAAPRRPAPHQAARRAPRRSCRSHSGPETRGGRSPGPSPAVLQNAAGDAHPTTRAPGRARVSGIALLPV